MVSRTLLTRAGALLSAGALAAGLMAGAVASTAEAAHSPNTLKYCSKQKDCSISINFGSLVDRIEGQTIAGQVRMNPSITASLRAWEIRYGADGKPASLRAAGPAFAVKTNSNGNGSFNAPTYKVTAPTWGGPQFIIQTSDYSIANYRAGNGLATPGGKWPSFTLNSARGRLTKTTDYTRYRSNKYHISVVSYAIPGQRYQFQAYRGGKWYSINESGTDNGLVRTGSFAAILTWSIPNAWGTGIYPIRLMNVTARVQVLSSSYAIYGPPSGVWGDQDGDRSADLLAVNTSGQMQTFLTRNGPALSSGFHVGNGWGSMNWIATLPDMDGNKRSELVARRSDGTLWLYRGTDLGKFGRAVKIGSGWGGMTALAIVPDINRDGKPELLARTRDGKLLRYTITTGGARYANQVGTGWNSIVKILSVGDLNRDGISDVIAIHKDGSLLRYALNSKGSVGNTAKVGRGWNTFSIALSPGDMDKDGRRDLVGRRSDGTVWFYHNHGNGKFGTAKQIGRGWGGMRLIA